jgi:RimJ/RimL family protein N-acetyltransferase
MAHTLEVALVPVERDQHLQLLCCWLYEPHVRTWWGDPDVNLTEINTLPSGVSHALITANTVPVGYVRWQPIARQDLEDMGVYGILEGAIDIDIFIGEVSYLGCGLGPRALQLVVSRLRACSSAPVAGLSTSVSNHAAIRAYEKAGFVRRHHYEDPDWGPCWLMMTPLRTLAA